MGTSVFLEVRNYDNDELRNLVKEIKRISSSKEPANVKQSNAMKHLFDLDHKYMDGWVYSYHNVSDAIKNEIIRRIVEDKF